MAKKIYFVVIDTTKHPDSMEYAWYDSASYMNDMAGYVVDFAKKNGTDPKDVRLYIYEKTKDWEKQKMEYSGRILAKKYYILSGK